MENINKRFELLKMARDLADEAYNLRRATAHNKWISENHKEWNMGHQGIPHPPFEQYPNETEIIEIAEKLYNFVEQETVSKNNITKPSELNKPSKEVTMVEKEQEHIVDQDLIYMDKKIKERTNEEKEEEKGFLPGWIRRSNNIDTKLDKSKDK